MSAKLITRVTLRPTVMQSYAPSKTIPRPLLHNSTFPSVHMNDGSDSQAMTFVSNKSLDLADTSHTGWMKMQQQESV